MCHRELKQKQLTIHSTLNILQDILMNQYTINDQLYEHCWLKRSGATSAILQGTNLR